MRAREIELLNQLVRLGSVSEAARAMNTTQPNASKMLKKIEEGFGLKLFERVNGRLHPTEEGRMLADPAEAALMSLQRLETLARDLREMRHGSLTVGTTPQLSREWVPALTADYMCAFPAIVVRVQTRNSRKLIEMVSERQIDIALGLLAADDPNVHCRRLFEIDMLAALPSGHALCEKARLEARDFDAQEFISSSMLDRSREQVEAFLAQGGAVPVERGEGSLACTRLHLVERGLGLTTVDALSAGEYARGRIAFRPLDPPLRLTVWSMRARARPSSRLVDAFEEMAAARAENNVASDDRERPSDPGALRCALGTDQSVP